MKRKWIAIVVLGALLATAVTFAAANELLTLRGAVQRARTEHTRIKLADLDVRKAEHDYDNTISQVERISLLFEQNMVEPHEEEHFMQLLFVGREAAEAEFDLAHRKKENEQNKLAFEAQQQYLNVIRTQEQKDLLESNLERAKDLRRLAEAAYNAGTKARIEVIRADAQVANLEVTLLGAESAVNIAKAALNVTIGKELTEPLQLSEDFALPEIGEIEDLVKATNRAVANRIEIATARTRLTVAERMMVYAQNRFSTQDIKYIEAEIALEQARLGVKLAEDGIRLEVFTIYQQFAVIEKQLAARQKSLELVALNYHLAKLRYESGIATQGEVMDAMLALVEQETRLLNETFDYYIDYLNWRLKTGLPVN